VLNVLSGFDEAEHTIVKQQLDHTFKTIVSVFADAFPDKFSKEQALAEQARPVPPSLSRDQKGGAATLDELDDDGVAHRLHIAKMLASSFWNNALDDSQRARGHEIISDSPVVDADKSAPVKYTADILVIFGHSGSDSSIGELSVDDVISLVKGVGASVCILFGCKTHKIALQCESGLDNVLLLCCMKSVLSSEVSLLGGPFSQYLVYFFAVKLRVAMGSTQFILKLDMSEATKVLRQNVRDVPVLQSLNWNSSNTLHNLFFMILFQNIERNPFLLCPPDVYEDHKGKKLCTWKTIC
jgi:hypothetical protein